MNASMRANAFSYECKWFICVCVCVCVCVWVTYALTKMESADADVLMLADDVIAYNGYYSFKLTKDGTTNVVHAKFTYVYKKDASGEWKILIHNSGMTPKATETYPAN